MANKKALKRFRDRFDKAWKKALLKCLADDLKDINNSQERKEMEYEVNENCNKIFTVKEFDREKVYYNKISGLFYRKNSKTDCIEEYFPDMWKEINTPYNDLIKIYFNLAREKTPPRTLKLEDLNKLWANKHTGKVGRIFISNRGLINFVSGLGIQSVIFGEYRTEEFFDTHAEATQTDLDNLTKG